MEKFFSVMVLLVLILTGCKGGNEVTTINNMKDLQTVYGDDYRVSEASNTVFLILCSDDTMYAFSNNENLGEVHSYNKTLEGTDIRFEDGTELTVKNK